MCYMRKYESFICNIPAGGGQSGSRTHAIVQKPPVGWLFVCMYVVACLIASFFYFVVCLFDCLFVCLGVA